MISDKEIKDMTYMDLLFKGAEELDMFEGNAGSDDGAAREVKDACFKIEKYIRDAQTIVHSYLVPNGIPAEEAMSKLIEHFDGPRQRVTIIL